jgi:hypothetical protein
MAAYRFLVARFREPEDLRGTFAPFFRASLRPMAIACLSGVPATVGPFVGRSIWINTLARPGDIASDDEPRALLLAPALFRATANRTTVSVLFGVLLAGFLLFLVITFALRMSRVGC